MSARISPPTAQPLWHEVRTTPTAITRSPMSANTASIRQAAYMRAATALPTPSATTATPTPQRAMTISAASAPTATALTPTLRWRNAAQTKRVFPFPQWSHSAGRAAATLSPLTRWSAAECAKATWPPFCSAKQALQSRALSCCLTSTTRSAQRSAPAF